MSNIRYHWLRFQNGYAYRECEIPLFDQGMVLIRGLNVDDGGFLGAGKTSPFEVFSMLQTGRVGKQRKGERHLADDIVNLNIGEGFEARLRFEVNDKLFEIVQCRKHPTHGNAYHIIDVDVGRDILPSANRKAPQNWVLQSVLGIDDKSFFNLIYMAQDFSNIMLQGTEGERQQSLMQMFGLDAYDDLYQRTKTKLAALQLTVQDLDRLQEELDEIETQLQQHEETPELVAAELAAKRAELREAQQQHDTALDTADSLQEHLQQLELRNHYIKEVKRVWAGTKLPVAKAQLVDQALCDDLGRQTAEQENEASRLRTSIRLLDQKHIIEERLAKMPKSRDQDEVQTELDQVRENVRRLVNEDLPKAERRVEVVEDLRKVQKPVHTVVVLQEKLTQEKDEQRRIEQELALVDASLQKDVCPTCGRPFNDEHDDAAVLKKKLSTLRRDLKRVTQVVHDLSAELSDARQYEELKEKLQQIGQSASPADISREIKRLTQEERRLVGELEAERIRETLEEQLATLPTESVGNLKERQKKAQRAVERLRQQQTAATSIVEKLEQVKQLPKGKVSTLRERINAARKVARESANAIAVLGGDLGQLERLHEKLDGLTKRRDKIKKGMQQTVQVRTEITCLQALAQAFGSKGLKRDRFAAILRDATEQTVPYYTDLLWPQRSTVLELTEANNAVKFALRQQNLAKRSHLISGGERNKAGLALLFGMRDLKEKYTGLQTNCLIVDEPFGNLDAYGTTCLLQVLRDLKDRVGTVLVIGNQRDVFTNSIWDQVWWAVREGNEARLYRDGLPEQYRALVARYEQRE